jgi:putative glutamine amidotransferase
MIHQRPLIGITMRVEYESDRFYLARFYSEAVAAAGGCPVHISLIPDQKYLEGILDRLDGVLLPGSDSDIDPLRFGEEPRPGLGSVHPIKDQTDLAILAGAESRGLPILAICFGMQALNVSRGGTLIQDIASQEPAAIKHQQGAPRDRKCHHIEIREGSFLSSITNSDRAIVNSHHHQAVKAVGVNLEASAWSSDGLIEAIEDTREDRWVVGVQWHPELAWSDDLISVALFNRFVASAAAFAEKRTVSTSSEGLVNA